MAEVYGYARCSTNELKQDIDRQRRELKKQGVLPESIYWEYASGRKDDREQLNRLLKVTEPGDTIVVTEVSRLTRSTQKLCAILQEIQEKELRLVITGSISFDCRPGKQADVMTKGMIQMWGVFAEMENDMIRQRIRSGMENARAKGAQIGHPPVTKESIPSEFYKYYQMFRQDAINVSELARLCKMSRTTVYKYMKIVEA